MIYVDSSALQSGLAVTLNLSGAAVGSLSVRASRYPTQDLDGPYVEVVAHTGTFPTVVATMPDTGFWYVWVYDDDGPSAAHGVDAVLQENLWLTECGNALRDRLEAHRLEFDAHLRRLHPSGRTFAFTHGFGSSEVMAPFVVVTSPEVTPEPVALGGTYQYQFRFKISLVCTRSTDETDETAVSSALGMLCARILNRPAYNTLDLAGGCQLSFCRATSVKSEMVPTPDGEGTSWFAIAMVGWQGDLLYGGP